MKLLICSDIHGDLDSAEKIIKFFEEEKCDKILLLGDVLYHGPRNDLPATHAPKEVLKLLNQYSDKIIAVRGNCDAEVDQMVLDFPMMADYTVLELDGNTIFATHGHIYNTSTPPKLKKGDVLLHGHTHIPTVTEFGDGLLYINPGSVALPKENNPRTLMIYENSSFTLYDLNHNCIMMTNI